MATCKQEGEASPETNSAGTLTLLDLGLPSFKAPGLWCWSREREHEQTHSHTISGMSPVYRHTPTGDETSTQTDKNGEAVNTGR